MGRQAGLGPAEQGIGGQAQRRLQETRGQVTPRGEWYNLSLEGMWELLQSGQDSVGGAWSATADPGGIDRQSVRGKTAHQRLRLCHLGSF